MAKVKQTINLNQLKIKPPTWKTNGLNMPYIKYKLQKQHENVTKTDFSAKQMTILSQMKTSYAHAISTRSYLNC